MVGLGTGLSDKVIALLKLSKLCDQLCDHFYIDPDLPWKARQMALGTVLLKKAKVDVPRGRPPKAISDAVVLARLIDEGKRRWPHLSVKKLLAMLKEGFRTNPKLRDHPQREFWGRLLQANINSLTTKVSYGRRFYEIIGDG